MRKGLVVILAVAMLIVSISSFNGSTLAAGAGTKSTAVTMTPNNTTPAVKPSALQPTTLTIATNNTAPVTNQSFTLSGMLTAGTTPLSGKTITLDRVDPSGTRTQVNTTTTTTTNGTYSFTRSESAQGLHSYQASFAGDTIYNASFSSWVTVSIATPPALITTNNTPPAVNRNATPPAVTITTNATPPAVNRNATPPALTITTNNTPLAVNRNATTTPATSSSPASTTPTATASNPPSTALTITSNNTTPAVNQSFTLSGTLTSNGTAVPGKTITLERVNSSGTWVQIGTATTTANGTYSLTYSDSQGVHTYYAIFAGDTTYGPSNVGCSVSVGTLTPTTITITSNNTTPAVNQSFTLSGTLTSNGTAVPGKTITLERVNSSGTWVQIGTATTTANGTYSLTYSDSQGVHTYYAIFAGDTTYGPSNVGCSVSVGTLTPTTITITIITDDPNPAVNQSFTLSGTLSILTVGTAPLSGETITLDRVDPSGTWTQVNTTTTTNGTYSFTRSESSQGTYSYYAVFAGDTAYGPSNAGVTLPIGNLQRSDIRILATNNTPAANQSYTLYGFLQDGVSGVPLVGQPIVLTVEGPSGQIAANAYTNTDANGAYSFTTSESAPGTYVCTVTFYGSSTYFISSTMCNVIIGNSIPTKLSLNISDSTPAVNQSFSISGYLTDINGTPLSGRVIFVVARLPSGEWVSRGGTITDSNGYYFLPLMSKQIPGEQIPGQYRYEVSFAGDGAYAQAVSEVEVAVGGPLQATNISINSTVAHPSVGEPFTLSGTLTDATGKPLAGEEIDLYRNVAGQQLQEGNIFQERYTDQNGYYFFVLNESTSGTYKYTAKFLGDETHAYSPVASVTLSVGTLTPSTITITSNNTTPAVNQSFTLSGTLTSNGTATLRQNHHARTSELVRHLGADRHRHHHRQRHLLPHLQRLPGRPHLLRHLRGRHHLRPL